MGQVILESSSFSSAICPDTSSWGHWEGLIRKCISRTDWWNSLNTYEPLSNDQNVSAEYSRRLCVIVWSAGVFCGFNARNWAWASSMLSMPLSTELHLQPPFSQGWGDCSVNKVLALQVWELEFNPYNSCFKSQLCSDAYFYSQHWRGRDK